MVLLSIDKSLITLIRDLFPESEVMSVSCLHDVDSAISGSWLLIDPRCVKRCCLEKLALWRRWLALRRVVFLIYPAAPEILLNLPQTCPGVIVRTEALPTIVCDNQSSSRTKGAWNNRDRIFRSCDYPAGVQAFVRLALRGDWGRHATQVRLVTILAVLRRSCASVTLSTHGTVPPSGQG